jgi:hypothetical protein
MKGQAIKPPLVVHHLQFPGRALAWSALLAITLLLVQLLQALAAAALVEKEPAITPAVTTRSTAGDALEDGDDVRARFLASLRAQGLGAWSN